MSGGDDDAGQLGELFELIEATHVPPLERVAVEEQREAQTLHARADVLGRFGNSALLGRGRRLAVPVSFEEPRDR